MDVFRAISSLGTICRYFFCNLVVIIVGSLIHYRAKTAAVKAGGITARLHALHYKNVFLKNFFPLFSVHGTVLGICSFGCVVDMYVFYGFVMGLGFKYNRECMISLHAKQDIWIKGSIFCTLILSR